MVAVRFSKPEVVLSQPRNEMFHRIFLEMDFGLLSQVSLMEIA